MKKFFCGALMLLCVAFVALAQSIPEFTGDDADKAVLIDVKAQKGVKDLLIVVNQLSTKPITYRLYYWHPKKGWQEEKPRMLNYFGDTSRFGRFGVPGLATLGIPIKAYKYLALVPADGKARATKILVNNHDLFVFVQPNDISYKAIGKGATEIDVKDIQSKLRDNIKLVSKSKKTTDAGFYIFGDKGEGFTLVGTAHLKEYDDTCIAETCVVEAPSAYSKYAVVSTDGNKYKYTVDAKSSDLNIYVAD